MSKHGQPTGIVDREVRLVPVTADLARRAGVTEETVSIVAAEVRRGELFVTVAGVPDGDLRTDGGRYTRGSDRRCPTCGSSMRNTGFSGDVNHRGGAVGVDISQWSCPECRTIIDDLGNVITKVDQDHEMALLERDHPEWFA